MEMIRRFVKWEHLVMILLVTTMQACTKKPEAEIEASKTSAKTNEYISFTNTSKDAESYYWDFGDGTTSVEPNPAKAYGKPGVYTVKMMAFSKDKSKFDRAYTMIRVDEIENTNSYFAGSYDVDVTYNNGCISAHNTYVLTVNPGNAGDEVILENFMDKRLNGVRGKVKAIPGGYEVSVFGNQEAVDNNGNTWKVVSDGDYIIRKVSGDPCVYVSGAIVKVNPSGNCDVTYSEEGSDCP